MYLDGLENSDGKWKMCASAGARMTYDMVQSDIEPCNRCVFSDRVVPVIDHDRSLVVPLSYVRL